jgi:hypothetical protein
MNPSPQDTHSFGTVRVTKVLPGIILASVCLLSVKAVYDIAKFNIFPAWFVPCFGLGVSVLMALGLYFVFQVWKIEENSRLLSGTQSVFLWVGMTLSFICTTSVHGFYPFRANGLSVFLHVDPLLKTNYTIAILGFMLSAALAICVGSLALGIGHQVGFL